MPRMSGAVTVAANSTSAQQLAGQLHEITQYRRAAMRFAAVGAATGVNANLTIDSRSLTGAGQLISFANRYPILGQDDFATDVVYKNQRLFLTFSNTTAGGILVNWLVDVVPF